MGNLKNAAIAFLAPLPSIFFYLYFLHLHRRYSSLFGVFPASQLWLWCYRHPLILANLIFFANVDILFWIIGLLQSNNWMIDLYWTIIPVMLAHFFAAHPTARANGEKWEWGKREDWRFNEMRRQYGKNWWWLSFFAVYVSQQIFLIGICLPLYAIHSNNNPWGFWDYIATCVCISGITIAYFADTQLYVFVQKNEAFRESGATIVPNLDKGLWQYSRHPNYFGEQLWWWGLYIYASNLGGGWMFIGPFMNSLCLVYVTVLVERRMLKREDRVEAYKQYQKKTSMWIPWFKSATKDPKEKEI
ncbi:hypothetical protein HPP92_007371 [Vanilla planifolia]|uniref:Steroid 5-alpha reductase C-terminal domain-containing protein n=1 Tax=Vanilla planifolia TaxID=51239 RepID=A0A835V9C6_VANPL|nr:hypothetical protein HPP92_007371 [Vanilla planifolia]